MDYDADVPEYAETGEDIAGPSYAQGCTGGGVPPCQCITLGFKGDGGGLDISQILAGAKEKPANGNKRGWWRVLRNGHLFVKSVIVTLVADSSLHQRRWCHKDSNGVCQGWTAADGDVFAAGFWDMDTNGWLDGIGPAQETVHA